MFPTRYFAARYFAGRYWPKVGAGVAGGGGNILDWMTPPGWESQGKWKPSERKEPPLQLQRYSTTGRLGAGLIQLVGVALRGKPEFVLTGTLGEGVISLIPVSPSPRVSSAAQPVAGILEGWRARQASYRQIALMEEMIASQLRRQ